MTFTDDMKKALQAPLDPANVKPPAPGKYGEYIEGWKTIEEANRIFGFDGWTRETVDMVMVCEYQNGDKWAVGYRAKVRVNVGGVIREGSAVGNGVSKQLYDAHESAIKEAETDAMKRALMTFGYPMGLALYDKSKANVGAPEPEPPALITDDDVTRIEILLEGNSIPVAELLKAAKVEKVTAIYAERVPAVMRWIEKRISPPEPKKEA